MSIELKMFEQYKELVAKRDSVNKTVAVLQEELHKANAEADAARVKAAELAAKIGEAKGGAEWLALKKDIATLAKALGKTGGVLAS